MESGEASQADMGVKNRLQMSGGRRKPESGRLLKDSRRWGIRRNCSDRFLLTQLMARFL